MTKVWVAALIAFVLPSPASALYVELSTGSGSDYRTIRIFDNREGDSDDREGVIDFTQDLSDWTATGTVRLLMSPSRWTTLVLTDFEAAAKADDVQRSVFFSSGSFDAVEPDVEGRVHLDGEYFGNTPSPDDPDARLVGGLTFTRFRGFAGGPGHPIGRREGVIGTPRPDSVENAVSPTPFRFVGRGNAADQTLGLDFPVTEILGDLAMHFGKAGDGIRLPGSATVGVRRVAEPSAICLLGAAILFGVAVTARREALGRTD